jgi:hypothetical protein
MLTHAILCKAHQPTMQFEMMTARQIMALLALVDVEALFRTEHRQCLSRRRQHKSSFPVRL